MKLSNHWIAFVGFILLAAGIAGSLHTSVGTSGVPSSTGAATSVRDPSSLSEAPDKLSATASASSPYSNADKLPETSGVSGTSVWERLGGVEVLATTQTSLPDGSFRRSRLLKIEGKYPFVIFEGTAPIGMPDTPDQQLANAVAKVANHMLVRPREGVEDDAFRAAVSSAGLGKATKLSPMDLAWIVTLPEISLGALDNAIERFNSDARIAYAEPDYLVFPADIPSAKVELELRDGILVPAMPEGGSPPSVEGKVYRFDAASRSAQTSQRLLDFPPNARVLAFDSPGFTGGPGRYNPGLEEQNFTVTTSGGIDVPIGNEPTYANNGTYHIRSPWNPVTIQHREGLPFSLFSIDLAELSTNDAVPSTISFTGHKLDGSLVTQSFTTDGVIDGIGLLEDFESFTFTNEFTQLSKVVVSSKSVIDNVIVLVEEPESPAPTPPQEPVIYDVTFDLPKHTVGAISAVSGPFAPSSLKGTPTVRSSIGTMVGPALEFKGDLTHEVRFGMRREAVAYRLEFNAYLDSVSSDFNVHFDGLASGAQAIVFKSNGRVAVTQNSQNTDVGAYPLRQNIQVMVDLDVANNEWELFINGSSRFKRTLVTSAGDLTDIRLWTLNTAGRASGIDNIRISAFNSDNAPTLGARLAVSPESLVFPELALGNSLTWNLELSNTGMKTLNIHSVTSNHAQFLVPEDNSMILIPGAIASVPVTFRPSSTGLQVGKINISSDDSYMTTHQVAISGIGVNAPVITVDPLELDVTIIEGAVGSRTYTVDNSGSSALRWNLGLSRATGSAVLPNDPMFGMLWGLKAPAPNVGGIDAGRAWSLTTGSNNLVIAVIDSGVAWNHPDLHGNLWMNPGEIAGNGIDDDGNGFIDDVYGWDFGDDDWNPTDLNGHGTHVAGTIAARGDNGVGVTGVCWNAKIMSLKFLPAVGPGFTSDAVKCINYATAMGAKLSNNSWGGGAYSHTLRDAIAQAGQAGAVFVAAAGNDALNNDVVLTYPASYPLDNIVAVAATNELDQLSYFSNYGATTVDVAAPGSSILSLGRTGNYVLNSGTSMAAPHVAGVAGLLMARNPKITPAEIKRLLLFGTDSLAQLNGKVATRGRLNAVSALRAGLPAWLASDPGSGTVTAAGTQQITLTVDGGDLEPGEYTETLRVSSNDPTSPNLTLPVKIQVVAENDYNRWLTDNFGMDNVLPNALKTAIWADLADADDDGVANVLEYLAGSSPTQSSAQPSRIVAVDGEKLFEFHAKPNDPDVSYDVEWSETLEGTWHRDRIHVVEDSTVGMPLGVHRIRVKLMGDQPRNVFFRLAARREL